MNSLSNLAALTAGLLIQSTVFAGTNNANVTTIGTNLAYGALKDARNNAGTENISCYLGAWCDHYRQHHHEQLYFVVAPRQPAAASYYCYVYSPSPAWIALVAGLNETSYLYFYGMPRTTARESTRRRIRPTCNQSTSYAGVAVVVKTFLISSALVRRRSRRRHGSRTDSGE